MIAPRSTKDIKLAWVSHLNSGAGNMLIYRDEKHGITRTTWTPKTKHQMPQIPGKLGKSEVTFTIDGNKGRFTKKELLIELGLEPKK